MCVGTYGVASTRVETVHFAESSRRFYATPIKEDALPPVSCIWTASFVKDPVLGSG
jgi:hypothetical protein